MTIKSKILATLLGAVTCAGVVQAELVAEWTFDGQNMTNSGSSGSVHDGAFNNVAVEYSTDTVSGSGHSLVITSVADNQSTGGGGYLSISNSATSAAGYVDTFDSAISFSYCMWVKSRDGSWYRWDTYGSKSDLSTGGWNMRMRDPDAGDARNGTRVEFSGTGGGMVIDDAVGSAPVNIEDQQWHLMTFTYDGISSNLNLYIDGELEGTTTNIVYNSAAGYPLIFGAYGTGAQGENLLIDSIQFYNHALSASEVEGLADVAQFNVDADAIAMEFRAPSTLSTGTVAVSYSYSENIEVVNVSISDESHAGAFSVLTSTPFTLTEQAPASTEIEFEFDNSVAGLTSSGQTATGMVTITWSVVGETATTDVEVPISVLMLPEHIDLSLEVLGTTPGTQTGLDLTALGTADWVMLGRGGDNTARDEMVGRDHIGAVTVTGTHGAWNLNAYLNSWSNGTPTSVTNNVRGAWEAQNLVGGSLAFPVANLTGGSYTLKVYARKYNTTAMMTASIGAESMSVDFDTAADDYGVFTVDFDILSAEETLEVELGITSDENGDFDNVSITAITLVKALEPDIDEVSTFEVISGGTEIVIGFDADKGGIYGIMATEDLVYGPWTNIVTDIVGTGGEIIITNDITKEKQFYRVYLED